jgi:predicted amidohydrolase
MNGTDEGFITAVLDKALLEKVRDDMPVHAHRRDELYPVESSSPVADKL